MFWCCYCSLIFESDWFVRANNRWLQNRYPNRFAPRSKSLCRKFFRVGLWSAVFRRKYLRHVTSWVARLWPRSLYVYLRGVHNTGQPRWLCGKVGAWAGDMHRTTPGWSWWASSTRRGDTTTLEDRPALPRIGLSTSKSLIIYCSTIRLNIKIKSARDN